MAHLTDEFVAASSNLEPEDDAENAQKAHQEIREELEEDDDLRELGLRTLLIGSYGREVSIKRIKDVDVFAMLDDADDGLDPVEIMDHLEQLLSSDHEVDRQDHSVAVDLPEYDLFVDVVPARPCNDHWEIPDPDSDWIETNPTKLGELTTELNKVHKLGGHGIYVPMVKFIRQVKRAAGIERPSGLYFEIVTYWAFKSGNVTGDTRASYLDSTLAEVVTVLETAISDGGLDDPTLNGEYIATKATSGQLDLALEKMRNASDLASKALAEEDICASAEQWRKLLGQDSDDSWVFPRPEGCEDQDTRSYIYVPGEKRGPHGSDRFA